MPEATVVQPTTPEPVLAKTFIPAEFHDREYLKPWLDKPWSPELGAEVFKKLDGSQKLLGQRVPVIPAADAKPEDVEAFLSKLRPEKSDAYDFKALGEGTKDELLLATLRDSFHHAGADPRQVARFLEKFVPVFTEREKAIAAEQKKLDDAFDALVAQAHGADNAKALETTKAALEEFTPAPLKPHIGKISNEALAIVSGVINNIVAKYGIEDKIKPAGSGGAGTGGDVEAMRAEMNALIAKPEYRDEFNPAHAATRAKVTELAGKIAAAK